MKIIVFTLLLSPLFASAETMCKHKTANGATEYYQGLCDETKKIRIIPSRPSQSDSLDAKDRAMQDSNTLGRMKDVEHEQELKDNLSNSSIGSLRANRMALENFYRMKEQARRNGN